MHVDVVSVSTDALIDVVTLRAQLQIDMAVPDAVIAAHVKAATDLWDGPNGILGRALRVQTLRLTAAHFPGRCWPGHFFYEADWHPFRYRQQVVLPYPDIVAIQSIGYVDSSGMPQTIDPSLYTVVGRKITPTFGTSWPETPNQVGAVTIQYQAGYNAMASPPNGPPGNLLAAIGFYVQKTLAMNRPNILLKQDTVVGVQSQQFETQTDISAQYDRAIETLLAGLRVET